MKMNNTKNNTNNAVRKNGFARWVRAASLFHCLSTGWQMPMTVEEIRNSRVVMQGGMDDENP